jgi:hypothetical protein
MPRDALEDLLPGLTYAAFHNAAWEAGITVQQAMTVAQRLAEAAAKGPGSSSLHSG